MHARGRRTRFTGAKWLVRRCSGSSSSAWQGKVVHEVLLDHRGSALPQFLLERIAADAVGVAMKGGTLQPGIGKRGTELVQLGLSLAGDHRELTSKLIRHYARE